MAERRKILIVDNDEIIAQTISLYLEKELYDTQIEPDGYEAIKALELYKPDLMVLDLMLPGMDGYEVCRKIRQTSNIPIIILSAKTEVFDRVLGLELGADDYMVKPFDCKELAARIKAILRRTQAQPKHESGKEQKKTGKIITFPGLEINLINYTVTCQGQLVEMAPKEIELLYFMASSPDEVFTREQLLSKVWGYNFAADTRTVDVHIKRLRQKLTENQDWAIVTVRGVGYKFSRNYKRCADEEE